MQKNRKKIYFFLILVKSFKECLVQTDNIKIHEKKINLSTPPPPPNNYKQIFAITVTLQMKLFNLGIF